MAAQAVQQLPEGAEWLYELKLDGYRALLIKNSPGAVAIRSRNNKDLTKAFPTIASALDRVAAKQTVIDGEIVALDPAGRPSFQALQHRGGDPGHEIVFYAFDLLHADGQDFTQQPLDKRRAKLPALLVNSGIRESIALPGGAADVIAAVRQLGLEGVIAKRRNSIYQPGERSDDWQKLKLENAQEFVVGGYRPDGPKVDALLVGYYEKKSFRFAAKVRAGLVQYTRRELFQRLQPLNASKCPFSDVPTGRSRWGGGITADEMGVRGITRRRVRLAQFRSFCRLRRQTALRADR